MDTADPPRVVPVETHPPVGADLSALPQLVTKAIRPPDLGASPRPGVSQHMIDPARLGWFWGFLPGPREWVVVALVVVALYGRSESVRRGLARVARPWTTRPTRADGTPKPGWLADRWVLIVTAIASAAVAAWVVTWMTVVHRPPAP